MTKFALNVEFIRFLLVGLLNSAFGYSLFAFITWLGISYPVAIGLATLGGIAFNYQTIGRIVFKNGASTTRVWRFAAVYVLLYLINVGGVALLLLLGTNVYIANAVLIAPLAIFAYLAQKKWVFISP